MAPTLGNVRETPRAAQPTRVDSESQGVVPRYTVRDWPMTRFTTIAAMPASTALAIAIEVSGRGRIVLRNQSTNGRGERPAELFEGVKGQRPKTEEELQEWLVSPEGKAATLFNLTSLSRWGELPRPDNPRNGLKRGSSGKRTHNLNLPPETAATAKTPKTIRTPIAV